MQDLSVPHSACSATNYVLTYSFPLEDLDPSEVDRALMLVATIGDTLEEEFAKADDR
jgi:hypothetical protein